MRVLFLGTFVNTMVYYGTDPETAKNGDYDGKPSTDYIPSVRKGSAK